MATQAISVVISGSNDDPAAVDVVIVTTENVPQSALLGGSDVDNDDTQPTLEYVVEGSLPLGDLQITNDGRVEFDPGADFDVLAEGETSVQTVTYFARDQHGAESGRASIRVDVIGENDAPTAGNVTASTSEDSGPIDITLLGDDIDSDDDVSGLSYIISELPNSDFEELALDPSNIIDLELFTFDASRDYQYLGEGESATKIFEYVSIDSHGLLSEAGTISIDITGENDAPEIDGALSNLNEVLFSDEGETFVEGQLNAQDPDATDVLSYFIDNNGLQETTLDGQFGTLQIDQATGDWRYDLFASPTFSGDTSVEEDIFQVAATDGIDTSQLEGLTVTILVDVTELL